MKINNIFIATMICAVLIGIFFMSRILWFFYTPILPKDRAPVIFEVTKGMTPKSVAYGLAKQNLLKHSRFFTILFRLSGASKNLQVGEYSIDHGNTPLTLLHKLVNGSVVLYPVTVIEGTTFKQLVATLQSNAVLVHTLNGLNDDQIMTAIGHAGEMAEGRFYPDTYKFARGTKDVDILKMAYNLMARRLTLLWNNRDPNVPYPCEYKALIAASMIEKETAVAKEKPIIAGVIVRRLNKDMLLQIDPTVIYGLGQNFSGKLTKDDLTKDSAFNTYLHKGLPPTPICMPSQSSIYAALHPDNSAILYYVAKGDGTHQFSETLEQQNAAIKKFFK
jgi:UPF0755 protein